MHTNFFNFRILVEEITWERPRNRGKDSIKKLRETRYVDVDWIYLALDFCEYGNDI